MDIGSLLCSESPATPSYPATPSHEPSPMQVLAAPSTFVHWTPPYDPPSPVQPSVASPPPIQEDDIPPMPPLTLDLPNVPTPDPILPAPQSPPTPTHPALLSSIPEDHGTSSWSTRNPGKPAQDQRFRPSRSQTDAGKRVSAEKSLRRAEKTMDMQEGILAIIATRDAAINDLAKRLFVKPKHIADQVNATTHYRPSRKGNLFNALVSKRGKELNFGNVFLFYSSITYLTSFPDFRP